MEKKNKDAPAISPDLLSKVRQKEVGNLLKKVSEGGTLTSPQWARVLEFAGAKSEDTATFVTTITDLCEALKISRPTFYALRKQYGNRCPKTASNGKMSVVEWTMFLKGINYSGMEHSGNEEAELRLTILRFQAKSAALTYFKDAGELVVKSEVEKRTGTALSTLRSRLLAIPHSISKHCEGKKAAEIFSIVDAEIRGALDSGVQT